MKGLSPIMFEDFVKPFQINLDEVIFLSFKKKKNRNYNPFFVESMS